MARDSKTSKLDSMTEVTQETFAALRTEIVNLSSKSSGEELDMNDPHDRRLQNCLRLLNMVEDESIDGKEREEINGPRK